MAQQNLLQIVQRACQELILDQPVSVVGNDDQQVQLLLGLANREITELSRDYIWQELVKIQTFTTIAAEAQTGSIPDDFDWYIDGTGFNRTTMRRLIGPLTPIQWEQQQANPAYISVFDAFRILGNAIYLAPTPSAGDTVAFEYVTKYRVADAAGNQDQERFVADDDTPMIDSDLVISGIKWRFQQQNGLPYAQAFQDYQVQRDRLINRNGGSPRLDIGAGGLHPAQYPFNIPDGNWPSS